jgi:hypothetical protein
MRKLTFLIVITAIAVSPALAAKYAGEPFSLGVGARALGMGGAAVAGPFDGSAGYWNPAGLNYLSDHNIIAMHAETFGSLLNHDFVGYGYNRGDTSQAIYAYGGYFYYLGGGGIKITEWDASRGRPIVVREVSHGDYLLAGALSGRIRDKVDFGAAVKIIYRDLGVGKGYGLTADIGALYNLNEKVRLGMTVTDVTSGIIRYSQGYSESIVPTVRPAFLVRHSIKDFTGRLACTGDIKFEGIREAAQYWAGEISLDTHFGLELSYREMIFGRVGLDIGNFTAGLGVDINRLKVDLAYLQNDYLDETFRVSAGYRF